MGAVPHEGGVAFRVWAPHAEHVAVVGDFNEWDADAHPLAREEGGYWSAEVEGAGAGQEYQFIIRRGGEAFYRGDPYARAVVHSSGNSVVYDGLAFDWQGEAFQLPPWNELVLYEMHVGTFAQAEGGAPGTLHSAIGRLDDLAELGVNAVGLMPVAEYAGDTSWGYNPAYPFAVESAYGGADALKAFVREAHARGIAVVLDVVYNHFGPGDLVLWRFDGWHEGDYGGIYFYNDPRADTPWGLTRPDYGRSEVRRYLRDNVLYWLEEFRLDGLRWDGTVFIRRTTFGTEGEALPDGWQFMQEVLRETRGAHPDALMIAEDLQGDPALTRPVEAGGAGFGAQWGSEFVHRMREALVAPDDAARDLDAVRAAYLERPNDDAFARVVFTESHDQAANGQARLVHEIAPDDPAGWAARKRTALGAALTLTAPGIPMLFQGQELLEGGWFDDTEPLDWARRETFGGIFALHRDLIVLRRNLRGATRGLAGHHAAALHQDGENKVLAVRRWAEGGAGDDVVVVFNLANRTHEHYALPFPAEGTWRLRFNSDAPTYADDFGAVEATDVEAGGEAARAHVALGPYAALVFSQDPS